MSNRRHPLAPFRHKTFRALWAATLFSNFGGLVQAVGAAWMMTMITDSATLIALVQASNTLPIMLFALASGTLADSFDRRTLLIGAQLFMAATSLVLAIMAWSGAMTPWLLLGFTFLIGTGQALYNPPWQASMGDLVPREDLPNAVTLNSVGFNLMRSVGPAAGGIITAAWGAAAAFTVNAISYTPLLVALFLWRPERQKRRIARERFISAAGSGLRYVALSPNLVRVLTRGGLFGLSAVSILALLPLVAKSHTTGGSLLFGLLLGCYGLGAILGALLNPIIREKMRNETIVRIAFGSFALAALALAYTQNVWLHALALLPAGAGWVLALSLFNVSVQLSTPRWVVARALALYQTSVFGGMAAGSWIWGSIASGYGTETALAAAALPLILGALIGRWLTIPDFSTQDLEPLNRFKEPKLRLDLRGRSGPLMITVSYQIDQKDVPEFLDLMAQRRQIRRRDGARNWALLRDLENPSNWAESYHIATWDDYIRHNMRRTKADSNVTAALAALHRGEGRPRVRRMIERQNVTGADDLPLIGKLEIP